MKERHVLIPFSAPQIKTHATVHTSLAKVAVERRDILISVKERAQLTQVSTQLFRRTAESSHPSHVSVSPGTNAVVPSPDSRTFHMCSMSSFSVHSFMSGSARLLFELLHLSLVAL